jgi:guanosine-3',5'-bis(diphosphate) 3'-pyrophosphohydrolase
MLEMLSKAIRLASSVHDKQIDKSGNLYLLHPVRVMLAVSINTIDGCQNTDLMSAAVLHDVIEDSHLILEDLRDEGFSEEIILAVDSVSKQKHEPYESLIARSCKNQFGTIIKWHDINDNLSVNRIEKLPVEMVLKLHKKYMEAKVVLWSHYVKASMAMYGRII